MSKKKVITKCGAVSIVGRPNVGKSTLLNSILEEKISIVSKIPQTTRSQIRGIYNDVRGQIIFIDTPGLHHGADALDKAMNVASTSTISDADCLIYLVDLSRQTGEEEDYVAHQVARAKVPVILGLNKIDIGSKRMPTYIEFWERVKGCPVQEMKDFKILPLSGEKGENVDVLIDILFDFLPVGPALYDHDTISDMPRKLVIAEIIREKLFQMTRQEVPHSIGVLIEHMQPIKKKTMLIKALVLVERDTQKEIVIGKGGALIKKVGVDARKELEELLGQKVFLELYVKADKNWRNDPSRLQELGYDLLS